MSPPGPQALAPTLVADRFPRLGAELLELLGALDGADWRRPTVCPGWAVGDVAAHLLDTALRRLAFERDDQLPLPAPPISCAADLVRHINQMNASGVETLRRLSPRLLIDLLALIEPQLQRHLAAVDPMSSARFGVSWAGELESTAWFDVAREYSERWHHQQQIRLAVAAPPLVDPWLSRPLFDTLLRALPHRYRDLDAVEGTTVGIAIHGVETYAYVLEHAASGWTLRAADADAADRSTATIALDEEPAWLLLTNGLRAAEARERLTLRGARDLAEPFLATRAVVV